MRMQAELRLVSGRDGVAHIDVSGEIDGESGVLVDACVASACRADAPLVVLDLAAVTALAPRAVRTLGEAREIVESAGRRFVLAHPAAHVAEVLLAADPGLAACVEDIAPPAEVAPQPVPGAAPGLRAVPPHSDDVETLVRTHRDLAERLAARFTGRGQPAEDLRQVAYVGLVTAAQRFDAGRGNKFATFAQATIVGELKKYFRDHAWTLHVARPVQELYLAARAASEDLTQELGRTPTPKELAVRLGATEEQVIESLEARSALHVDSLDRPRDDDDTGAWHDTPAVEDGYRVVEERSWLVPALSALPQRERDILRLRFFEGLPQSAIAARVGISQMHVSRLLARSLARLRSAANE
ncbi:MAG TPA: sigma-70 family RNA polymerase sigma factor [Mycobacteriales bacterium]|jgi:RNA polymerase sigma-B factor|nr:sigma-70 family RNA polymerase sigma factor [Mycobacteriales bacterium]